ncbi:MAG: FAD-binding protein [Actinophytocola sp.]|nr:FAD-binding protein [Actinophytocola sp.]
MWGVTLDVSRGFENPPQEKSSVDSLSAADIAAGLRPLIEGSVDAGKAARVLYSTDASNYRHLPLAVVVPRFVADVEQTLGFCSRHRLPVLPRGAGTSVGGQASNTAVVLDFTRYLNRITSLDEVAGTAVVEPGLVLDDLRDRVAEHGLTFGPDPSTHNRCTLGGMIGNNACGSHSVAWGKTDDNVRALDVALADGTRFTAGKLTPAELAVRCARTDRLGQVHRALRSIVEIYGDDIRAGVPKLGRRVSGYNLDALLPENGFDLARALVGTEGTCVTMLGATVSLVEAPRARALTVLGFPSSVAAADAVPALLDLPVLTVEGIDVRLVEALAARDPGRATPHLPTGKAWLYVESGGRTAADALEVAQAVAARARSIGASHTVVTEPATQRALWRIREEGAGLATRLADGSEAWSGWEDAAVPPERLGDYLRAFEDLMDRHGRRGVVYGHFGDGCLHVRIDFPLTEVRGASRYRDFLEDAADLVVAHGGSLSGEHGDGQARAELLPRMYTPRMIDAFRAFKAAFDPENLMNPGRIVDPAPLDADLRVVVAPATIPTRAQLALPADSGDLASAARRCVGVGKCITDSGGVMCPSYRATRSEQHSTRGRARLLFEMLAGDVIDDGWNSREVADALDLCLGCKGCKTDCPVGVDMATYKVEFLSRHYQGRRRPVSHYAMGALPRWLKAAGLAPGVVNALTRSPLAAVFKRAGGIAPERDIPPLANSTMRRQLRRHSARAPRPGGDAAPRNQVLLLPDTFTNHFDPGVGADAAAVLDALGYEVVLPHRPVCCGLTWYSTGQLDTARRVLRRTLDVLEPWLEADTPIVGLEPSCTAMFKHDAEQVLGADPRVAKLSRNIETFAELLTAGDALPQAADGAEGADVLTQVHCHQYADLGYAADQEVLAALGVSSRLVDGGCCGLAGNFGFERGHYDVSVAAAEQQLLPAIRSAPDNAVVHADGFSCRTQIRQLAGREPEHLATLVARAWGVRR